MQASPVISLSPSFNTYSSGTMADIAARVVEEFRKEAHPDANLFDWAAETEDSVLQSHEETEDSVLVVRDEEEEEEEESRSCEAQDDDDDEFEFAFVSREPEWSPISADEIFYNGQIKPVYPVFNRDLLLNAAVYGGVRSDVAGGDSNSKPPKKPSHRMPLRKLMIEERETTTSCSSSEADELESVPSGTYCVWAPKKQPEDAVSDQKCTKSNSTGSSKRWRLRDLLHRSNSDGKDTFVFLTPGKKTDKLVSPAEVSKEKVSGKGNVNGAGNIGGAASESVSAHYVRNKTVKEGERRRSYLPYKQDLMGLLANVNGLSRNLRPF